MKHLYFYLLITIVSLPPLVGIFVTPDLPHTHDGLVHLPRIASYFKALKDIQIPVRWAGDLNYGYGMPLFNFIYQLPYAIASIFLFLGLGLVNAFKITLALSFLLSGVFMFLFSKAFFQDERKAFLVTMFYQFAPFRLVELFVRGSFGEVYTYTFLPLILFGLTRIFKKQTFSNFSIIAIATALLVLSHNSLSLVFFIIALFFTLFFAKERKTLFVGTSALFFGLLLSSFYWLPAILEHKYTYGDLFMKNLYLSHFPPFQNLFIPNFNNSEHLQTGGVAVQIGLFHVLASLLAVGILAFRKRVDALTGRLILFCLALTAITFFFMQPISSMVWEHIPMLRQFQFPWRFLAVTSFTTAMLSVSFFALSLFKKKFVYLLLLTAVIISTIYYWRPPLGFDRVGEKYYWNYPLDTTYFGETDLIWSAGPAKSYPKERVEIIGGEGIVKNFNKKSQFQTFDIEAKTEVSLLSNTQYFPGWTVYVDGNSIPIEFQDPNNRGLITFSVPKGKHKVLITFEETKTRLAADLVSLSSLAIILSLSLVKLRRLYEA